MAVKVIDTLTDTLELRGRQKSIRKKEKQINGLEEKTEIQNAIILHCSSHKG